MAANSYTSEFPSLSALVQSRRGTKRAKESSPIKETVEEEEDVTMSCLEALYDHQRKLERLITELQSKIEAFLAASPSLPLSSSIQPPAIVSHVRQAIKEDHADRLRKCQVFLRGISPTEDPSLFLPSLLESLGANPFIRFHSLRKETPHSLTTPFIVNFHAQSDAHLFLRLLSASKRQQQNLSLSARINYNTEDLQTFQAAWRDAIDRNNKAKQRRFVVINLSVVELETPGTWTVTEARQRTSSSQDRS